MEFGAKILYEIPILGGIPITETVVNTWIIMAILTVLAFVTTRRFEKIPKGVQNVVEALVEIINNFTASTMGENKRVFSAYMGTLFVFLVFANLLGLVGLRPPTADLNTTFALSLITFVIIHYQGIRKGGLGGYLKGYFEPFPLLMPINLIGEIALPISLAFRLFGNIVGGLIIMALIYSGLAAIFSIGPIPILQAGIPAVLHMYFDVFSGVLQTFIFMMISMIYISNAMD
ncbi:F0F1 ATP synthase subunit A [Alkaliphilus crotonatoxidans]